MCRHHLRDAELLRLGPKQAWRQRSHMLLVHGSLHSGGVAAEQQAGVLAPAVLPWLAAHLQCDAGALPGSPRAAAPAQRLVAGPDGALLLACPEERGTPLTPSSSAGSTPDFGSPFAGAAGWPGSQQPQQQEGVELQAGSTEQGGDQRLQQEQQEHLEPAGRPLRRVKSRRQVAASDSAGGHAHTSLGCWPADACTVCQSPVQAAAEHRAWPWHPVLGWSSLTGVQKGCWYVHVHAARGQ